ncbi:MAG: DUF424 domain-containing protein [Methanomicrobium sp.]|nr:DUF424 domain-containing protein [Methanomicrobium sp.]MBQ3718452.1 DUF424 domain-containing protein [Methanomicrobium sp.]MBQ4415830.1 DUF424 domain-containing protein [Methanomicrobium sp.]
MYLKVYRIDGVDKLLAACDRELINRKFTEGDLELDISDKFYGTELADRDELLRALKKVSVANLAGERVIAIAVEAGIIDADACIKIGGVPHVQIL